MATRRYGLNRGATSKDVTSEVGAAVSSKSIEVTIDLAAGIPKGEVMKQLGEIIQHIKSTNWPPA